MHHGYVTPRTLRGIFWLRFVTAYLVGMAVTSSLVAAFRNCYGPLVWKTCSAKCTWTSFSRTDLDGSTFFHCLTRCTTRSSRLGCWLRMNLLCTRPHLSRTSTIQIPLLSTNCLCSRGAETVQPNSRLSNALARHPVGQNARFGWATVPQHRRSTGIFPGL